jgi:hypothetical protein
MLVLLETEQLSLRETLDLVRGAVDARLHPPTPSILPPLASIAAGGLWTFLAVGFAAQPVPADWPGFTVDLLPLALAGTACLLVALIGLVLRLGDMPGRLVAAMAVAIVAVTAFVLALAAATAGVGYGAVTGATMSAAAIATAAIAVLLLRRGDLVGTLVLPAALALIVPASATWILFGLAWTVVGAILLLERARQPGNLWAA